MIFVRGIARLFKHARIHQVNSASLLGFGSGALFTLILCFCPIQMANAEMSFQLLKEIFPTNGGLAWISGPLAEADDGSFYGTTHDGGSDNRGTIFKLTSSSQLTVAYSFPNPFGTNGVYPQGGLVRGSDGAFYGAANAGGYLSGGGYGYGTVFRFSTNGVVTRLAVFVDLTNGWQPTGPLIQCEDGNFYGVTDYGGTDNNNGVVFRVSTNGLMTTLASFKSTNGAYPVGLVRGSNGAIYGTTVSGGGTVFKFTTNGELTTLVYFNGTNGSLPNGLTKGTDGVFYGTTTVGGASNAGTIFSLTEDGTLTTLFSFPGTDSRRPSGDVILARNGNFYGVAAPSYVFDTNFGTLFKLTPGGELSTVFHFNGTNAMHPSARFTQGRDGNYYGVLTDVNKKLSLDTNAGAIFRLVEPPNLAATRSTVGVDLTWTSFTNGLYNVEFKPSMSASSWTTLTSNVPATGTTTSVPDVIGGATNRYYRVVLLP